MTKPLRFLVVEDELLIAMGLELELKQAGFAVCKRVTSGEKAIIAAVQEHPDVILMDIRLAGKIDGIEAAQQIQSVSSIPIIFMSGYPDKEMNERVQQQHPLGHFIKPIRIQDILSVVTSLPQAE
jgi:CheY-like chemotaxis protein